MYVILPQTLVGENVRAADHLHSRLQACIPLSCRRGHELPVPYPASTRISKVRRVAEKDHGMAWHSPPYKVRERMTRAEAARFSHFGVVLGLQACSRLVVNN